MAVIRALFYGVAFVGGLLFIRHMWREIQNDGAGTIHHRTLDEIQQLPVRLEAAHERLHERMDRLEGKLGALPPGASSDGEPEPAPGDVTGPP